MPEWGTQPANHYLPRRKTEMQVHADELERADNPLKVDGQLPQPRASTSPSLDDVTSLVRQPDARASRASRSSSSPR